MRRVWLMVALVLCGAIAAGCWLFWQNDADETVPWPAPPPSEHRVATVPEPHAAEVGVQEATSELATADLQRARASFPEAAADARIAAIDVLVVGGAADVAFEPLAHIDVSLILTAGNTRTSAMLRRTDPRGIARFEVVGGDGRTVWAACALGAEGSATLVADQTVQITLRIVPRLFVQGSVIDSGGRGIPGASIELLPWVDPTSDVPRLCRVGRSRSDGSFRVGLAAGGRLGALHPDFSPSAMYFVRPEPDRTKASPTVTLQLAMLTLQVKLEGKVLDASGQPVSSAEIECRGAGTVPPGAELAAPPQRETTNREGAFLVRHLPPGRIEYTVRAAGHGSVRGSLDAMPGQLANVTVRLQPACEVHGFVRNADGTPVAKARVWSDVAGTFFSRSTESAADGSFRLRDLPPGDSQMTAREAPEAGSAARQTVARLALQPLAATEWTAVLDGPGTGSRVEGVVVDQSGAALAQWRVVARTQGSAEAVLTAADGRFAVPTPKAATVDVRVYAPRQPLMSFAAAVVRGVVPGDAPLRITVEANRATGSARGRVSTAAQQPIPATISCWHHERAEYVRSQAATDGSFALDALPVGTIDFHFEYAGCVTEGRRGLEVAAGGRLELGVIELGMAGILHGNVYGPDGLAPAQCQVAILLKEERLVAEYVAGAYRFAAVPPGEHQLQVQGLGVAGDNFKVQIQAGLELQRNIRLQAGVPRRFVATVPAEAKGAVYLAIRVAGSEGPTSWLASAPVSWTGATGTAEWIAYMAPGFHEVASWAGAFEARKQVEFALGDDSPVHLTLVRK